MDEAWFNGACGCSAGRHGNAQYAYGTSGYTNDSGYDNEWARRTIVTRPDDSYITQYFDETGQALSRVSPTTTRERDLSGSRTSRAARTGS